MSGALDTSLLLRLFLRDIPEQFERAKLIVFRPGAKYVVSDLAIAEAVYALEAHYHWSRSEVGEFLRGMTSVSELVFNREAILAALQQYVQYASLSFNDCLLAHLAKTAGALPLFTFDHALARRLPEAVEA